MDISRREFLKGGAAAVGGVFAASALPSFADSPALFPKRGKFERLSLVSWRIRAGAKKPFTILHISDTHLTAAYPNEPAAVRSRAANRSRTFGGMQEEALRESLAWAKEHVDYVVHTGDMIDFQSKANFDLVKRYYGQAAGAMIGSLGNHEFFHGQKTENEESKNHTRAMVQGAFPFDISFQSTVVNGINFVTLDNVYGTVTAEQVARFEIEVKKGLPIILCMHCPIETCEIARAGRRYWRGDDLKLVPNMSRFSRKWNAKGVKTLTEKFHARLEREALLKGILAGHIHVSVTDRFSKTAREFVVGGNFLFHGQEITIE